jgi:dTDP-4-dehydrorhamnose reductase
MLDGEKGIFHIANDGAVTWAGLAQQIALLTGGDITLIKGRPARRLQMAARRPYYSVLKSERGILLPSLDKALEHYLEAVGFKYETRSVAV